MRRFMLSFFEFYACSITNILVWFLSMVAFCHCGIETRKHLFTLIKNTHSWGFKFWGLLVHTHKNYIKCNVLNCSVKYI